MQSKPSAISRLWKFIKYNMLQLLISKILVDLQTIISYSCNKKMPDNEKQKKSLALISDKKLNAKKIFFLSAGIHWRKSTYVFSFLLWLLNPHRK